MLPAFFSLQGTNGVIFLGYISLLDIIMMHSVNHPLLSKVLSSLDKNALDHQYC